MGRQSCGGRDLLPNGLPATLPPDLSVDDSVGKYHIWRRKTLARPVDTYGPCATGGKNLGVQLRRSDRPGSGNLFERVADYQTVGPNSSASPLLQQHERRDEL